TSGRGPGAVALTVLDTNIVNGHDVQDAQCPLPAQSTAGRRPFGSGRTDSDCPGRTASMEVKAPSSDDRRVLRTRRMLRDALIALLGERGWDRISVQDICD